MTDPHDSAEQLANVSADLTTLADAQACVRIDAAERSTETVGSVLGRYRALTGLTERQLAEWLGIVDLLERLGIRQDAPWIWMTTDGPITPEHARWRINGFFPEQHIPFDPDLTGAFANFSLELLGVVLKEDDPRYGLPYSLTDQPLDVRFIRTRWQRSVLYVQYTATEHKQDVAIHGAFLKRRAKDRAKDRAKVWAARDLIITGLQPGRPPEATGNKQAHWRARVTAIGEPAARVEYYRAEPRGPGRYDWWDNNILRWLRRQKHIQ